MKHPDRPQQPPEIDDTQDRMGSMEPLDFSASRDDREGRVGDTRPRDEVREEFPRRRVRQAGMTGGEALTSDGHEDGVTLDDLSPETLFDETGARSPRERGEAYPRDKELSVVKGKDIGAGGGLDEAELGRVEPLDGKPWGEDTELEDEQNARMGSETERKV